MNNSRHSLVQGNDENKILPFHMYMCTHVRIHMNLIRYLILTSTVYWGSSVQKLVTFLVKKQIIFKKDLHWKRMEISRIRSHIMFTNTSCTCLYAHQLICRHFPPRSKFFKENIYRSLALISAILMADIKKEF